MIVLVDAGNTRIKWVTLPEAQPRMPAQPYTVHRCALKPWLASDPSTQQSTALAQALRSASQVWVSNVAGLACAAALHAHAKQAVWHPVEAAPQVLGLHNHYTNPAQLGVDRWLTALAVWQRVRQSALVVSAGTALTIDALLVSDACSAAQAGVTQADVSQPCQAYADYLGGSIQPGLQLMRQSLLQGTAQLQAANPLPTTEADWQALATLPHGFAQNTAQAMLAGCQLAMLGAIAMQYQALSQRSAIAPILMLTGGDAAWLQASIVQACISEGQPLDETQKAPAIKPLFPAIALDNIRYIDDLVIEGLAVLAQHT